jgi:parallel beta-helix repeat protein
MRKRAGLVIVGLVLCGAVGQMAGNVSPAAAVPLVRLVSTTGADTGNCTATACLTVNYAIGQAVAGDVVQLSAGTYSGSVAITKALTLTGPTSGSPAIVSGGDNVPGEGVGEVIVYAGDPAPVAAVGAGDIIGDGVTILADDVTITHLEISHFGGHGITGAAPRRRIALDTIDVSYNGWYTNAGRGVFFIATTNDPTLDWGTFRVTQSTFRQNRLVGIDFNSGTADNITIDHNTIDGNGDSGITLAGGSNSFISDNTVTNNGRFGVEVRNPTGPVVVTNNRVAASLTTSTVMPARWPAARTQKDWDYAGIVVYRRGVGVPDAQANQPAGVTISNNETSGYLRSGAAPFGSSNVGEGHGIVIEGTGHVVDSNYTWFNDVGLLLQSGQVSNTTGTNGFDRGDATAPVAASVTANQICANRLAGVRLVGAAANNPFPLINTVWGSRFGPTTGATRNRPWAASGEIGPDNIDGAFTLVGPLAGGAQGGGSSRCALLGGFDYHQTTNVPVDATIDCQGVPGFPINDVITSVIYGIRDIPIGTSCTITLQSVAGYTANLPIASVVASDASRPDSPVPLVVFTLVKELPQTM